MPSVNLNCCQTMLNAQSNMGQWHFALNKHHVFVLCFFRFWKLRRNTVYWDEVTFTLPDQVASRVPVPFPVPTVPTLEPVQKTKTSLRTIATNHVILHLQLLWSRSSLMLGTDSKSTSRIRVQRSLPWTMNQLQFQTNLLEPGRELALASPEAEPMSEPVRIAISVSLHWNGWGVHDYGHK